VPLEGFVAFPASKSAAYEIPMVSSVFLEQVEDNGLGVALDVVYSSGVTQEVDGAPEQDKLNRQIAKSLTVQWSGVFDDWHKLTGAG